MTVSGSVEVLSRPSPPAAAGGLPWRSRGRLGGGVVTEARPERIGRYVVQRELGSGGMGIVYAGRDEELGRRVAIKLVRSGAMEGRDASARLLREAQALARLAHPYVVQVYEAGRHDEQVYDDAGNARGSAAVRSRSNAAARLGSGPSWRS